MPEKPDWAEKYDSTKYNGIHYPCPGGWVFYDPEEGGGLWYYCGEEGEGIGTMDELLEAVDRDDDAYNEARGEPAFVNVKSIEYNVKHRTETIEWELKINSDTVFRQIEPDEEDVWAATAEAMAQYDEGEDLDGIRPESGRLPDDVKKQQDTERRKEENQSIGSFL